MYTDTPVHRWTDPILMHVPRGVILTASAPFCHGRSSGLPVGRSRRSTARGRLREYATQIAPQEQTVPSRIACPFLPLTPFLPFASFPPFPLLVFTAVPCPRTPLSASATSAEDQFFFFFPVWSSECMRGV